MNKKGVEAILAEHGFLPHEFKYVFLAMSKILRTASDEIEKINPFLTYTIGMYLSVSENINDINSFCDKHKEFTGTQ